MKMKLYLVNTDNFQVEFLEEANEFFQVEVVPVHGTFSYVLTHSEEQAEELAYQVLVGLREPDYAGSLIRHFERRAERLAEYNSEPNWPGAPQVDPDDGLPF